jgi:hypothetical protein
MGGAKILIEDGGIHIADLGIPRKGIAEFLQNIEEDEREASLVRALEVGIFCLERAKTSQDTEFVRRQVESLVSQVEKATEAIPIKIETALIARVGINEGQVLAPVNSVVAQVSKTLSDKVKEVKDLLFQEIDPAKETTTLGKALRHLRELLDAKRVDSIQGVVEIAISRVTAEDGCLAKAVKAVVAEAVKPLANEVSELAKEVRGQEAAAEALEQTTEKGACYEDEVVTELQGWSRAGCAEIHHVGSDNKPGDVVVDIGSTSISTSIKLVIEVRDRQSPVGRKVICDTLKAAQAERQADAAIYVSRYRDGLAREIGEWAEGETELGPWVACTNDHLITAIRFLIVQHRLKAHAAAAQEVDAACIMAQLQRIRTTLDRIKNMSRRVNSIHSDADGIKAEAETLREEVRDAMTAIEDSLRAYPVTSAATSVA